MSVVTIDPPDPDDDWPPKHKWTVRGDLRSVGSGYDESNYEYEAKILEAVGEEVAARLFLDTEDCELWIYCRTEKDAKIVATAAEKVAGSQDPDAAFEAFDTLLANIADD